MITLALNGILLSNTASCLQRASGLHDFCKTEGHRLHIRYKCISVQARVATLDSQLQGQEQVQGASSVKVSKAREDIRSLCQQGQLDKALDVLVSVEQQGIVPPEGMYRSLLKACAKKKALPEAKRVHAHLAKYGLESTRFLGENMVCTFVTCGSLEAALEVFHKLPERTVFSWTAVISGYALSGQALEALRMFRWMQSDGLQPNTYTFVSLLKACASIPDLEEGKRIHAEALKYSCGSDLFVCTSLVDMYAKCGSIVDAQNVFDGLSQRDIVSWNAMLAAYAQQGQAEKAMQLYQQMREEDAIPNERSFVSTLQACCILAEKEANVVVGGHWTKVAALEMGKAIHADARKKGYDKHVFVANTLVCMYGKCGSIVDARNVFNGLPQRTVVSWTAMLAAYVLQGQGAMTLQLYKQMQEDDVSPNNWTIVSALQACGLVTETEDNDVADGPSLKRKALEEGKAIHEHTRRTGCDSDVFVGNALVSMYGKCGSIGVAQNVFDGLAERNVVSWNAMLAAYVQQEQAEEVFQLYEQMLEEGVRPNERTFVSMLQACAILAESGMDDVDEKLSKFKCLEKGKTIHAEAWMKGYDSDIFIDSTLVDMYGKCGSIHDAQAVFDGLFQPSVVAWSAMLAAYVEHGQGENALQLYEGMQIKCVSSNDRTFVSALQACGILAEEERVSGSQLVQSLEMGKAIHADAWRRGYRSNLYVGSSLISLYGKCGRIEDAWDVFHGLSNRNVVAWTAMLAVFVEQGKGDGVFQLFTQMQEEGVSPDVWTFLSVLQACGLLAETEESVAVDGQLTKIKCLEKVKAIHCEAWRRSYGSHLLVGNTLVTMYGKCGSIVDAQNVFDGLLHRDVVSWNAFLTVCSDHDEGGKVLQLYRQMKEELMSPNEITNMCVLQACSTTGTLDVCKEIHNTLVSEGDNWGPVLGNTLIHAYGRCASMVDAQAVFDALPQPDVVSWTTLLAGYARQGDYTRCLQCYEAMRMMGMTPNGVTFLWLLSACIHTGLVREGVKHFESMSRDYGISPEMEHYVSLVDLLGRAGCFTSIEELLLKMPMKPDLAMWSCLLAACRKYGKVELGKHSFDHAVRLDPKHSAAYVLMWNIYADAGLWDHAKEVMQLRLEAGAWKKPGQTWIEQRQEVHTFVVGDCKHPHRELLLSLLARLMFEMEEGGHNLQNAFLADP